MPDWLADLHGSTYAPWARRMNERSDILLPLVIDLVIFDVALGLARRRHRIGYDKALTMLRSALYDYVVRMLARRGVEAAQ